MPSSLDLTTDKLRFIIHHVVMRPRVPQEKESDITSKNSALLDFVSAVANNSTLSGPRNLLSAMVRFQNSTNEFPQRLANAILHLKEGDAFALYISMQNAGLIFRRLEDFLRIEVFEASPVSEAVIGCKGRLKCSFPGPATAIRWEIAERPEFLKQLGRFLHHMDIEQFTAETLSKSRKGGNNLSEIRDVTDPRYIVDLFTGMMRGLGERIEVNRISKNLRDEVNWKSTLNPWRRSGMWLVIRVALQTTLSHNEYKLFILEVVGVILDQTIRLNVDNYTLSCISRKLVRRASKIGEANIPEELLAKVLKVVNSGFDMLSYRWRKEILDSARLVEWDHHLNNSITILENTILSLHTASSWIEKRIEAYRDPTKLTTKVLDPQEKCLADSASFPQLREGTEVETAIDLISFEDWIEKKLENWCLAMHISTKLKTIGSLAAGIKNYHMIASKAYTDGKNILDISRMFLTIMEMWVQLDKAICEREPLMCGYSPEIPSKLLEAILLIRKKEMERLLKVENYLRGRHLTAGSNNRPSIFSPKASATSFAVRYYDKSHDLQDLRSQIIKKAETAREQKRIDLLQSNQRHKALRAESLLLSCECQEIIHGEPKHLKGCKKCSLTHQANSMEINVHEWPLPANELDIKTMIFELKPPEEFAIWRDTTYYIMLDVCETATAANSNPRRKFHDFSKWEGLASFRSNFHSGIIWASSTKPMRKSHYSTRSIPALESDVLVKHAGQYMLVDTKNKECVESRHISCTLAPLCRSELPDDSYRAFSYAVDDTLHTHNEVIAEQHKCPTTLTLHEYEAFTSLRSGDRLQWYNILTELHKDNLTFKNESVFTLVLHASCHVGAGADEVQSDWRRASHLTLSEETFSRELLEALRQSLVPIEDNWEQANTLKLLVLLARRLASCGHHTVKANALDFLKKARRVCLPWIEGIQEKLKDASEENRVKDLRNWLLRVLGIQCNTFNVEVDFLPQILATPEDIVEFIHSQINVHQNCLGFFQSYQGILDPNVLSEALQTILPTQNISGVWSQLDRRTARWWRLLSEGDVNGKAAVIHLNILQGKLLVDGQPSGRLPEKYFTHETYGKLLGNRIIDVIPSRMPGMSYQSKEAFYDVTLHFHLAGSHLIIRKQDVEDHEYIPASKFDCEIPTPLIENGSQWLNLNQGNVVFYQSDAWWAKTPSPDAWRLSKGINGVWTMNKGQDTLLGITGNIHNTVHRALQPIETLYHTVTTIDRDHVIRITLPRYRLKFFVTKSHTIECDSIKGWIIDQNQSLGTFIGLKSFLKLKSSNEYLTKECILLPFGSIDPKLSSTGNHSLVEIHPPEAERTYTIYQIDKVLGRILDDGTLKARYTKIYLHALTSGILTDPLTDRTGISESVELLKNAASFSFQTLNEDEASILMEIAGLTPSRHFYPDHLRKMQKIEWKQHIPMWIQDDELYPAVQDIFDDWNRRQFLLEGSCLHEIVDIGSKDLFERGRNSSSAFSAHDVRFSCRHLATCLHIPRNKLSDKETYVEEVAKACFEWEKKQDLDTTFTSDLMHMVKLSGPLPGLTLEYSPRWAETTPIDAWCSLYELCRQATKKSQFGLLFIFGLFVYRGPKTLKLLRSLLAVAASRDFTNNPLPLCASFHLDLGVKPAIQDIKRFFESSALLYDRSKYHKLLRFSHENDSEWSKRRRLAYKSELKRQIDAAALKIFGQWPASKVKHLAYSEYPLLDVPAAMLKIDRRFLACHQNLDFSEHLDKVAKKLSDLKNHPKSVKLLDTPSSASPQEFMIQPPPSHLNIPTLKELLKERSAPENLNKETVTPHSLEYNEVDTDKNPSIQQVASVIGRLKGSSEDPVQLQYAEDQMKSLEALKTCSMPLSLKEIPVALRDLQSDYQAAVANVENILSCIYPNLSPATKLQQLQEKSGLWPSINKLHLLQSLRLKERCALPREWKEAITTLGEALTWEQRASRLIDFAHQKLFQEFDQEIRNIGRQGWDASNYTDWLLLELDSEILIRPAQASIALAMMDDSKANNSVMQLNMGEGKSAIIIPAVAAALADTKRLVRSMVLKTLSIQMFQILVRRLSGLCNRRIYFLPLWRSMDRSNAKIQAISEIYQDCMNTGGILLSLPEHVLSFQLMGIEMLQGQQGTSNPLIDCQRWLDTNVRDVLDESDEILHTQYQLIYTIGTPQTLDGGRDRWVLIQELLDFVQEKALEIASLSPTALEIGPAKGIQYRPVRVLDNEIGKQMLRNIAADICTGQEDKVPSVSAKLRLLNMKMRILALKFITVKEISLEEQNILFNMCGHLKTQLLVLRGLIADGILIFILDKRYRVDYGLDVERSALAVPFRAKDRPAVNAEFGHPEVAITLTCLTYYYGGLRHDDLQICFDLLLKTDNPDLIYEEQVEKDIFRAFKYNKSVIDFYLSEFVFPREAKGFPNKLSTNGWDIVGIKNHNTTGFSGTNDNRYLLPTSIQQLDIPQQAHTNSLVLKKILLEENNTVLNAQKNNIKLEAKDLLAWIASFSQRVQVLLDVGAQILELSNYKVAEYWLGLDLTNDMLGAVFFEDDRLFVLTKGGIVEPFASSALSMQLDRVLVYLDQAHTRGTDLKLPVGLRAAVTLGPKLIKDQLVQGCMRMRKLGAGHSLIFLAPPEIHSQIQKLAGKNPDEGINTSDVLLWTMLESCEQIQRSFSSWANQGFRYLKRKVAWEEFQQDGDYEKLEKAIMEKEAMPLTEMYGGSNTKQQFGPPSGSEEILRRLTQFNICASAAPSMQEEQEREMDHETEEEFNIERPGPTKPRDHQLHADLVSLTMSGIFNKNSKAFCPAYDIFRQTSAQSQSLLEDETWKSSLYITFDFMQTVELESSSFADDYLRPVRWILSVQGHSNLIVLSPYEANCLMPIAERSKACSLHPYAPKVTKSMRSFEFLDFCPIQATPKPKYSKPDLLTRISLNAFAGQLFFHDEEYYHELCRCLGVYYGTIDSNLDRRADGWVSRETRQALGVDVKGLEYSFSNSPIPLLTEITKMRRKGQGFSLTHLGSVINARVLKSSDF
ncbi:hypothetical protein ABW20_dc0106228 [Dactylellina cionopaga]|nr:hypothetical protein ABW20_dc0106228 [Dactylellina cionopaga]